MKKKFIFHILGPQFYKIYVQIYHKIEASNISGEMQESVEEKVEIATQFLEELAEAINPEVHVARRKFNDARINKEDFPKNGFFQKRVWPRSWGDSMGKNGIGSWWLKPDISLSDLSNLMATYIKHPFLKNETLDWIFISVTTFLCGQSVLRDGARSGNPIKGEASFAEDLSGGAFWKYTLFKIVGKMLGFIIRWSTVGTVYFLLFNYNHFLSIASTLFLFVYMCHRLTKHIINNYKTKHLVKEFEQNISDITAVDSTLNSGVINLKVLQEQIFDLRKKYPELYSTFEIIFSPERKEDKKMILSCDLA